MDYIPDRNMQNIAVVLMFLLLPVVFYGILNIFVVIEKILSFIEKILIRIFGEFVSKIFRVIFGILGGIISVLRAILSVFIPKKKKGPRLRD
jgi:uncharacterized membrane protein required for colicin V production